MGGGPQPPRPPPPTPPPSGRTPPGAAATFNWLIDALLACPAPRAAYLRRLERVLALLHGDTGLEGVLAQV